MTSPDSHTLIPVFAMASDPTNSPDVPKWRSTSALALGLIGFAASVATLYATPIEGVTDLGCGVRALDCGEVLGSRWGKVAGIPLGVLGGAYFACWTASLVAWRRSQETAFLFLLTWILAIGAAVSLTLLSLLFFVIEGNCLFCLLTHAANIGAALLLRPLRTWRVAAVPATLIRGVLVALAALLVALGLGLLYETRVDRAEAKAREETIW